MSTEVRLYAAAREGDIDLLYTLIQQDPHVLDPIDALSFVETPLHVAAAAGHLQFATEIMTLKPSFAVKRNQKGFCPIHLAMQPDKKTMVLRFVEINEDLVRVKGREGITPLHLASQNGDVGLLEKFLEACPDSLKDVTVRSETALHIAVKNKQYDALQYLIDWLKKNMRRGAADLEHTILNWKDEEGNTILHISALNNDSQAFGRLLNTKIDINAKNLENSTALDLTSSEEIKSLYREAKCSLLTGILVDKLRSNTFAILRRAIPTRRRRNSDISEAQCNAYLVLAALVATATYQAALSPPSGLYQAGAGTQNTLSHRNNLDSSMNWKHNTGIGGNSVMSSFDFIVFSSVNMLSFLTSTSVIFGLLPVSSVWWPIFLMLFAPTALLQWSYILSMMLISPTPFTSIFLMVLFLICLILGNVLNI